MTTSSNTVRTLSDDHLLRHIERLAVDERTVTVQLIAALAELDGRQLYLAAGCSSLFTYCTQVLRLSEHAAYGRIEAARAARRYPIVLELLVSGDITLTTITLLAAHLTPANHRQLLEAARRKSRRDVERLVAAVQPRASLPSSVRKLPERSRSSAPPAASGNMTSESSLSGGAGHSSHDAARQSTNDAAGQSAADPNAAVTGVVETEAPRQLQGSTRAEREAVGTEAVKTEAVEAGASRSRTVSPKSARPTIAPLTPQLYRLQLTMSAVTHEKLRRAQDLMRHSVPSGDPAVILDRALTVLLDQLERRTLAASAKPRARIPVATPASPTRHIPASIRRAVWARDEGRCAFVGTHGRCTERGFLEFHHVKAYAEGGETSVGNLQLRCRSHNQYEARQLIDRWRNSVRTELPS
jgi:hypothetical protein